MKRAAMAAAVAAVMLGWPAPKFIRAVAAAGVLAALLMPLSPVAAGQTPPSLRTAADPAAVDLAQDRGISLGEAEARLEWQTAAPALEADLGEALGPERFGGVWIGRDDDRIKVGIVDRSTAELATARATVTSAATAHGLAAVTDIVLVRHSLAALIAANDWLGDELVRVNNGAEWPLRSVYLPDVNAVQLRTPALAGALTAAQQAVVEEAERRFGLILRRATYTERPQPDACLFPYCNPPLRAGIRINPTGCTLGFLARGRSSGRLYGFTAGHCVDDVAQGTTHWTRFTDNSPHDLSSTHGWVFSGAGDAAVIRVDNEAGWRARAWVYVRQSPDRGGEQGTVYNAEYPILRDSTTVQFSRVCKSGRAGDTSCGEVLGLGAIDTYEGVTVRNLAWASYCRQGGDSGGPVYANHTAYGIHVNGDDDCSAYYQGIRGAENLLSMNVAHDAG
jgi:hypothetical protein